MLQLSPGCRVAQLLDWEKPPLATTDVTIRSFVPSFDSVMILRPLTLPAVIGGKLTLVSESETSWAVAETRTKQNIRNGRARVFFRFTGVSSLK